MTAVFVLPSVQIIPVLKWVTLSYYSLSFTHLQV